MVEGKDKLQRACTSFRMQFTDTSTKIRRAHQRQTQGWSESDLNAWQRGRGDIMYMIDASHVHKSPILISPYTLSTSLYVSHIPPRYLPPLIRIVHTTKLLMSPPQRYIST